MKERYERVKKVLAEKRELLETVAKRLLDVEIISEKEFKDLVAEKA